MWTGILIVELDYYFHRLIENFHLKFIISVLGSLFVYAFGEYDTAIKTFIFLLLADFITGVIKSAKRRELSSWISRKGLGKVMSYAIAISIGHQMSKIGIPLRHWSIMMCGVTEAVSLLENLQIMGFKIPKFLSKALLESKENLKNKEHK